MIPSSLFVLDMVQKRFCYIKPDDLFLCGHSMEEAMTLGYDFFSKIIHPEDLPLWKSFLGNLSRTLQENSDEWSDYFGLFRLLPKYPFITKSLERYSYHRLIPVRKESGHYYLIGIVSDSKCKRQDVIGMARVVSYTKPITLRNEVGIYNKFLYSADESWRSWRSPQESRTCISSLRNFA